MASKRKAETSTNGTKSDSDSDASDYAPSAIDVDFNYVSPVEIDFAALKRLTQQLFHTHSPDLNLSALVDDILYWGNKSIGTVVKVEDDEDGDPFAFASVINLAHDSTSEASKVLRQYYDKVLTSSSASTSKSAQSIQALLSSPSAKPLQIFHERMINLPPQIMPPLYRMLFEEVAADSELNTATHLIFFSRVFSTSAFDDEADDQDNDQLQSSKTGSSKKQKKTVLKNKAIGKMKSDKEETGEEEMGVFHPEDGILAKHALQSFTYRFPGVRDSDESFNAPLYARIVIVERKEEILRAFQKEIEAAFIIP